MDILQLLEVLRPAGHIVTVKIDNDESITKTSMGVLIALSPVIIAVVSLFFTSKQFKKSLDQQMDNFNKGYIQQAEVARLTARLATEAEIKKEWCRDVRKICTEMMAYAMAGYIAQKKIATEISLPTSAELAEEYLREKYKYTVDTYNKFSDDFDKMSERVTLLYTYLDGNDNDDSDFFNSIKELEIACLKCEVEPKKIAELRNNCSQHCRVYINKKIKEISEIPLSFANE